MPTVRRSGLDIHYTALGEGRPIVLGHSFLCSGEMWARQVGPLAAAGYRVINVDARGHGESGRIDAGFTLVDQTKIVTAASELARNTIDYGGGGTARLELIAEGNRRGLRVAFEDQGPGIPDIEKAMTDHYTTGNGLGLGLGGARRLVNEFDLSSRVGEGTRVVITRWK